MNNRHICAGVDLGGTTINIGLVSPDGRILAQQHCASEVANGVGPVLDQIAKIIHKLKEEVDSSISVKSLGIGVAGKVDFKKGLLREATNLSNWIDVKLGDELSKRLGMDVVVDNDANVAALGEHAFGAGRGINEMLMITLGTGVGGGLILGGKIYRGADGVAGEFGHTVIQQDGPICSCGRRGCVESFVGVKAILQIARAKLASRGDSSLHHIEIENITPKDISLSAQEGDRLAIEIFCEVGTYLGIGIANVANFLNIERVVVGGGVAKAGDFILEPARTSLKQRALKVPGETVKVVPAALGDSAGLVGAARLAMLEHMAVD